jgi:hypothetical protein
MFLEALRQPLLLVHQSHSSPDKCHRNRPARSTECDDEPVRKLRRVRFDAQMYWAGLPFIRRPAVVDIACCSTIPDDCWASCWQTGRSRKKMPQEAAAAHQLREGAQRKRPQGGSWLRSSRREPQALERSTRPTRRGKSRARTLEARRPSPAAFSGGARPNTHSRTVAAVRH